MKYHHYMSNIVPESVLNRMMQLTVLVGRDMDERLARDGVSRSRVPVLWVISASGPQTQRELSEALRVSPRNITGLVNALSADGLVSREPHPSDRRAVLITLTGAGQALVEKLAREQSQFTAVLFEGWEPAELAAFARGLDRSVARLQHMVGAGQA